jgi:hypothetical protein
MYSEHLNTGLIRFSNGGFVSSCRMVWFLNGRPSLFFILYSLAVYVNRLYNSDEHIITQQIEYQIILARAHPKLYVA